MEITARVVEAIPRGNLRVPRDEFVAVWDTAERLANEKSTRGEGDWYLAGVVVTCRWIACATVIFSYPRGPVAEPASAPITRTSRRAHEELIERETLAAEVRPLRAPQLVEARPGWNEAVIATLRWAWRQSAKPPIDVHPSGHSLTRARK